MSHNIHQAQSHEVLRSWQSQRNDINHHKDFVLPMFIGNDDDLIEPIVSMPDVYRYGCKRAIEYLEPLVYSMGLRSILLFPVMTKSDQVQFGDKDSAEDNDDDDDDDDGDESDQEIISSSNSSASQPYTPQSSSSSGEDEPESSVAPVRLVTEVEPTTGNNIQNPFLDQNEGEEDRLLEDQDPNIVRASAARGPIMRQHQRSQDVRLIKGMALKDKHNPVLRLIPMLRAKFPKLLIICDVCLCAFTSTGHCCLFDDHSKARAGAFGDAPDILSRGSVLNQFPISNKVTCQYLAMLSVEYARRGCNVVAPSDMMDGRILTIRERLDENRLHHVSILSYSAKFASAFYGPFRQATDNAPQFGDRRAYQLPPGSRALALKAVQRDIEQGADFVMVKPGGPYLDIVRDIKDNHPDVPVAVYQVSGEYSMLKAAASAGVLDLRVAVNEVLTSFRRAGATIIISYFTPEILRGNLTLPE